MKQTEFKSRLETLKVISLPTALLSRTQRQTSNKTRQRDSPISTLTLRLEQKMRSIISKCCQITYWWLLGEPWSFGTETGESRRDIGTPPRRVHPRCSETGWQGRWQLGSNRVRPGFLCPSSVTAPRNASLEHQICGQTTISSKFHKIFQLTCTILFPPTHFSRWEGHLQGVLISSLRVQYSVFKKRTHHNVLPHRVGDKKCLRVSLFLMVTLAHSSENNSHNWTLKTDKCQHVSIQWKQKPMSALTLPPPCK